MSSESGEKNDKNEKSEKNIERKKESQNYDFNDLLISDNNEKDNE